MSLRCLWLSNSFGERESVCSAATDMSVHSTSLNWLQWLCASPSGREPGIPGCKSSPSHHPQPNAIQWTMEGGQGRYGQVSQKASVCRDT